MTTLEERVTGLEAVNQRILAQLEQMNIRIDEMNARINSLDNRINTELQVTVGMWITTMAAVLAVLVAVLVRT